MRATLTPQHRAGDFAQAMMDLGATICTPKKPACCLCPWNDSCAAHARGEAGDVSAPHAEARRRVAPRRGLRRAAGETDFCWCARGPPKGLLGGMTEVPTTEWIAGFR